MVDWSMVLFHADMQHLPIALKLVDATEFSGDGDVAGMAKAESILLCNSFSSQMNNGS